MVSINISVNENEKTFYIFRDGFKLQMNWKQKIKFSSFMIGNLWNLINNMALKFNGNNDACK